MTSTTESQPGEAQPKSLFEDINADNVFSEIESLCMNCHEQGTTRLLLTRVPFFKEIIVMAFSCPHCGYESNEIQSGSAIQDKGVKYVLKVQARKDLNRQVIKSDTAVITIPELDFEIPAITQKGSLNTIEGFLQQSVSALKSGQEDRQKIDAKVAEQVEQFIGKLQACIDSDSPTFTVTLDDPAGNSFIENPYPSSQSCNFRAIVYSLIYRTLMPANDPQLQVSHYERTEEQNLAIGLTPHIEQPQEGEEKEAMIFPGVCSHCNAPGETKMVLTNILFHIRQ